MEIHTSTGRYNRNDLSDQEKKIMESFLTYFFQAAYGDQPIHFSDSPLFNDYYEIAHFWNDLPLPTYCPKRIYKSESIQPIIQNRMALIVLYMRGIATMRGSTASDAAEHFNFDFSNIASAICELLKVHIENDSSLQEADTAYCQQVLVSDQSIGVHCYRELKKIGANIAENRCLFLPAQNTTNREVSSLDTQETYASKNINNAP